MAIIQALKEGGFHIEPMDVFEERAVSKLLKEGYGIVPVEGGGIIFPPQLNLTADGAALVIKVEADQIRLQVSGQLDPGKLVEKFIGK